MDIGCVASHGHFSFDAQTKRYEYVTAPRAATAFLFKVISRLQRLGTVPMIDLEAYTLWLDKPLRIGRKTSRKKRT